MIEYPLLIPAGIPDQEQLDRLVRLNLDGVEEQEWVEPPIDGAYCSIEHRTLLAKASEQPRDCEPLTPYSKRGQDYYQGARFV